MGIVLTVVAVVMLHGVALVAGFKRFTTDLRGFTGRAESLDASTTQWLMKGLGFLGKAAGDAEVN